MKNGNFSVVIPIFKRPRMAHRAIASACAQDVGDREIEIIVVDDGSPEPFVYEGADARVTVVRLSQNRGAPAARNAGVAAATGSYVAFLDSDDIWLPGKLARQVALLEGHGAGERARTIAATAFYCPNRATRQLEMRIPIEAASVALFASGCWFNPGTTVVAPREALLACGPFDESLGRLEDYEWFLRFARAGGRLLVDPVPGAVVAPSGSARSVTVAASADKIVSRIANGSYAPLCDAAFDRMQAYLALERGAACLGERRYVPAVVQLARSFVLRPRLRASVETFWDISTDVPAEIVEMYDAMLVARRSDGELSG